MLKLVVYIANYVFDVSSQEVAVMDMRPDHLATSHKNKLQQNSKQDWYSRSQKCLISNLVDTEAIWITWLKPEGGKQLMRKG